MRLQNLASSVKHKTDMRILQVFWKETPKTVIKYFEYVQASKQI